MEGLCQRDQHRLHFAANNRIGNCLPAAVTGLQQIMAVEPGVQPKEAEMGVGVQGAGFPGRVDADAQCGVHGNRNGNQVGAGRSAGWEVLDGQVGSGGVQGGFPEGGQRPSQAERLMTEFVAGEQQN